MICGKFRGVQFARFMADVPTSLNARSLISEACKLVGPWALSETRHCLDLRPSHSYAKAHLVPSTSIPLNTLESRFSQLPPKNPVTPLLIVTHVHSLFQGQPVGDLVTERGWSVVGVAELPLEDEEAMDKFWEYAQCMHVYGTGKEGAELLFKPSPVLGAWIDWIERDIIHNGPHIVKCALLDIGCGSGRDMGFLAAREFRWLVNGLDNWGKALQRAEVMVMSIDATRLNSLIHAKIDEETGDIITLSPSAERDWRILRKDGVMLILIIRYFPRLFFKWAHKLMQPGGYLVFSHFTNPQRGGKEYDSPPCDKRVQPGEVESMLADAQQNWEILRATYSSSEDDRSMWDIVARWGRD